MAARDRVGGKLLYSTWVLIYLSETAFQVNLTLFGVSLGVYVPCRQGGTRCHSIGGRIGMARDQSCGEHVMACDLMVEVEGTCDQFWNILVYSMHVTQQVVPTRVPTR